MTIGGVRDFFRKQLNALSYREWTDGFVIENIPSTILDSGYHLDAGRVTMKNMGVNGSAFECHYPITLKVFSKGYRNPAAAIDAGMDKAQAIVGQIVAGVDTLNQQGLKHVHPQTIQTQPLQLSNTHVVMLTMVFDAVFVMGF